MKSSPELWAECSDAASLARHLGQFGEIRITKLEPETAVAWEGSAASGTVTLEPSGWGTRVILTVTEESSAPVSTPAVAEPEPEPEPAAEAEPEPAAEAEPEPEPAAEAEPVVAAPARPTGLGRLWGLFRRRPAVAPVVPVEASEPEPEPAAAPEPQPEAEAEAEQALTAALDSLGQAHHRPYSRS